MTGELSRCPTPEALAAFVAGNLSEDELKMTAEHLLECDDCRFIVGEAARVDRHEQQIVPLRPTRWPWWLAAAAAALACLAFLTMRPQVLPQASGIQLLVNAAPRDARYIEPRVTGGFPWAPLHPAFRGDESDLDPGQMKLVGAAGQLLDQVKGDQSAAAKHAGAVAQLLVGHPEEAATRLEQVAKSSPDATVWSDLAAARFTAAVQNDDPSQLADALAAADSALRVSPTFAEALFNRALIIEHLGMREQARTAWERYLALHPDGEWAREAGQHLKNVRPVTEFRDELNRHYQALASDASAARALAKRFPQDARVWGESEILCRWARARKNHNADEEAAHLRVATTFGDELAKNRGEHMLAGAVAAIERADDATRNTLADAHIDFREAQKAYKSAHLAEAERMFKSARVRFEQGRSPVALLAAGFAANTIFDQGRIAESRAQLEQLLSTASAEHPAHRAQLQWQLGLVYGSAGHWGDSIRSLTASASMFEQIDEKNYATIVREILAQVYDRIGDSKTAWRHRMIALQELGRADSTRLKMAIQAAARTAAVDHNWPVSLSLLGLQLELARGSGEDLLEVETLLFRARIAAQFEHVAAARRDLLDSQKALQRIADPALRERAEADQLAVEAFVARAPSRAIPLLSRAIDFHRRKGRRMFLPELLLNRGRAFIARGDNNAAAADFEAGIRELETQRTSIDAGDERWGMFATADELFEEAVALAVKRQDSMAAWSYAERARSRELLESIGQDAHLATGKQKSPTDAVIIEYASLPTSLVIFILDHGRIRHVEEKVLRSDLTREVEGVTSSATSSDRALFRRNAAALYTRLLAPVADRLTSERTLVFVPDGTLAAVPFAALIDDTGTYVIERHPVIVAPSAAVFTRLSMQPRRNRRDLHLLIVEGPSSPARGLTRLTDVRRESEAVAAAYGTRAEFAAGSGQPQTFAVRAATADVIHFVGHSVGTEDGDAALLTTRNREDDRLDVREIASMRLRQTRTVVLAACSTARGPLRGGEGTISVARAFIAAGVPSVIATLWPIADAPAAEFFPRLHHHLASGTPPAKALRAAQLECIHREDAPPAMWAAVQIIGS